MEMKIKPMGDYYVWYCDWCDSRNSTLWTKLEANSVCCNACLQTFEVSPDGYLNPCSQVNLLEAVQTVSQRHIRWQAGDLLDVIGNIICRGKPQLSVPPDC